MILEKKIEGDYYTVTSEGNVITNNWKNKGITATLKPSKDHKGYLRVGIIVNNKLVTRKVHRLVAIAFIPNPENKPQVNHINGIKHDNRVENLEWSTNKENALHSKNIGLLRTPAGWNKGVKGTKFSEETILSIRKAYETEEKMTIKKLSDRFGVSETSVSRIVKRQSWKNI